VAKKSLVFRRAFLTECVALAAGALSLTVLPACGHAKRPDGGTGLLAVGATAPDFGAVDASGAPVRLSQSVGHSRVVYFYPKDETPGCTKEACAFRDAFDRYTAASVVLFGVSRDTEESHKKFRENHKLPFALVADEKGDVQKAYGVPDKFPGIASRVTFLVDKDGKVQHVWENVDPGIHADEVLAAVH
jgi:peroxiredoxin Q/BCP